MLSLCQFSGLRGDFGLSGYEGGSVSFRPRQRPFLGLCEDVYLVSQVGILRHRDPEAEAQ